MESMVPVCDKRYHIYNRFRNFWAEIKKLWNYPWNVFTFVVKNIVYRYSNNKTSLVMHTFFVCVC